MPSYENEKCPVCGRLFGENDDIVTCPVCGTPHHRECYNRLEHCANADRHGSGFEYKKSPRPVSPQEYAAKNGTPVGAFFVPSSDAENNGESKGTENADGANQSGVKRCIRCGSEIAADAQFCDRCGARQPMPNRPQYTETVNFDIAPQIPYADSNDTLDGNKISDIAFVVRSNTKRFIPKFIKGKKLSWNWSAFIFGPYYMFFRKMYKQGSVFLALQLAVSLIAQGLYSEPYSKLMSFMQTNAQTIYTKGLSGNLLTQAQALYEKVLPMVCIIFGANLVLHVIAAMFSDLFYKNKVFDVIKNVDKRIEEDSMLEQIMPMQTIGEPVSPDGMRKMYLGRLGGTSIFAPITAFFVLDLITSIISQL